MICAVLGMSEEKERRMDKKWVLLGVIMAACYGWILGDFIVWSIESRKANQERIEQCRDCRDE